MQKRKALDSGFESEEKKQMTEKEEHTVNIVDAMQPDSKSMDHSADPSIIAPNTNKEDAKDNNNCTSVHPIDISVAIKKENILISTGAHPEIKHDMVTVIDSNLTEHTVNIVDAMQPDSKLDMAMDHSADPSIIAPNTNKEDAKGNNNCTSVHPIDISVTIKKENILISTGAHPEIKHDMVTVIDSNSTEVKTTSSDQIKCVRHNGGTKFINISLDKDIPISSLQDIQGHNSADGLALPSNEGRDVTNKSQCKESFNDKPEPLVSKVESYVSRTADAVQTQVFEEKEPDKDSTLVHEDSSDATLQAMGDSIAVNSGNGSVPEEVQKSMNKEVEHSIHEQDGSKDAWALLNEDLTDESYKVPEASGISAEGNLKALSSPIRGVIHDISSVAEPNEKTVSSLCKKEEVNFSFQTEKKFHSDESSDNHSEKVCSGVESNNTLPGICKKDDLNATSSCDVKVISNNPRNEAKSLSIRQSIESSCISDPINFQDKEIEAVLLQPERNLASRTRKKLIVLDLNGLLADFVLDNRNVHKAPKKVGGKAVFKRPFCDDFLKYCFETFEIGVWSSRRKYNVDGALDYIMGDNRHKLLFCWDQSHCTYTGFKTRENVHKPLVLKELKKLWLKEESDLPWEKGDYSPSNTLLVDDSPYKALCNPPNTGIFPYPYHFDDENDTSLGPGGDLRIYLERLSEANDVQLYVQENPFGQPAITKNDSSWEFYLQIIEKVEQPLAPA
ncbi:uncharacterized protein LOC109844534 [Asparagus officinalis]|nr:uncharacterized protein LOC109844534 [Asparagus officinalis]